MSGRGLRRFAVALAAVPLAMGACNGSDEGDRGPSATSFSVAASSTTTRTESTSTPPPSTLTTTAQGNVSADSPSQSEADAIRDGVILEIAALTPPLRINPLVRTDGEEGIWLVARLTDQVIDDSMEDGCSLGNVDGTYGIDVVCTVEYGEILLVDANGEIVKAYPMPGAVPSWIFLGPAAVYAGRIGDGALPDATVIRIDRATLDATIVLMPAPDEGGQSWPPHWHIATPQQMGPQLVGFAADTSWGTPAESWIGNVVIDLDAIDSFLAQFTD